MLTFYSDPVRKQARIDRAKRHVEQDRLVAGTYRDGNSNRGCSVGCDAIDICNNTDENPHKVVADHDGVPEWLEHLRDAIFEGLEDGGRSGWHVALAEAIPVGVDIDIVRHQLADWILSDDGPMAAAVNHPTVAAAILHVQKYHQDWIAGNFTLSAEAAEAARSAAAWSAAESAAWSAAESAAESAARSAARSAAWSAALSARSAARSAALSAALSAKSAAALSAAYRAIADKTIELLTLVYRDGEDYALNTLRKNTTRQ